MASHRPPVSVLAWSAAGLLGGHHLAYALVYRDPAAIAHALADTGHGWTWLAPLLAVAMVFVAVVTGLRGDAPVTGFRARWLAVAAIQVTAFVAMEAAERLAHGVAPAGLVPSLLEGAGWAVLLLGLAIQVLIAGVVTVLSRVVATLAAVLRRRRARAARTSRGAVLHPATDRLVLPFLGWVTDPRGPPLRA